MLEHYQNYEIRPMTHADLYGISLIRNLRNFINSYFKQKFRCLQNGLKLFHPRFNDFYVLFVSGQFNA